MFVKVSDRIIFFETPHSLTTRERFVLLHLYDNIYSGKLVLRATEYAKVGFHIIIDNVLMRQKENEIYKCQVESCGVFCHVTFFEGYIRHSKLYGNHNHSLTDLSNDEFICGDDVIYDEDE